MNVTLFSTEIYRTRFNNPAHLDQLCQSAVLTSEAMGRRTPLLSDGVDSSLFSWQESADSEKLHQTDEFKAVTFFIEKHAKIYWDQLGYYPDVNPKIYQSWVSVYRESGMVKRHSHARNPLSAVLYLDASPDRGNIVFENPLELLLGTQPYTHQAQGEYNDFSQEIEVSTGDLIIFPGYLKHYTRPNATNQKRIVFVGNLNMTGVYHNPFIKS